MSDYFPSGQGFEDFLDPDWPAFMQTSGASRPAMHMRPAQLLHDALALPTYDDGGVGSSLSRLDGLANHTQRHVMVAATFASSHIDHGIYSYRHATVPTIEESPDEGSQLQLETHQGVRRQHYEELVDQTHAATTTTPFQSTPEHGSTKPAKHRCTINNCSGEYIRKADLTRHQKKHSKTVRYDCPILACKFRGDKANTRRDKFVQHLFKGHPEARSWPCLVDGCDMKLHSIVLLAAHSMKHLRPLWSPESLTFASILTAVSIDRSDCPIRGCHMKLSPKHLMDDHTLAQRLSEAEPPENLEIGPQQCALTCPVCRTAFPCDAECEKGFGKAQTLLREHIAMKHVALDQEHVRGFGRHGHWYLGEKEVSKCPGCDFRPNGNYREMADAMQKHLDLLWDNPLDLYRIREQILRIDTSFWRHPVFDDLRPRRST